MKNIKVYVLHWEYSDKSAYGIESIYADEQEAINAYELLTKYDCTRNWYVDLYVVK